MDLPELAYYSIKKYLIEGKIPVVPSGLPEFSEKSRAGVFVSIHKKDGALRGCIGTIFPTRQNIAMEVINNAISAATLDNRFSPISDGEINDLDISVDLLSSPETVTNISELDPKKYGVIVSAVDGRQGVLLPDIEGVDSISEQIKICLQKGGINSSEEIDIKRFTVTRFH